jgi:hypothetical protein
LAFLEPTAGRRWWAFRICGRLSTAFLAGFLAAGLVPDAVAGFAAVVAFALASAYDPAFADAFSAEALGAAAVALGFSAAAFGAAAFEAAGFFSAGFAGFFSSAISQSPRLSRGARPC